MQNPTFSLPDSIPAEFHKGITKYINEQHHRQYAASLRFGEGYAAQHTDNMTKVCVAGFARSRWHVFNTPEKIKAGIKALESSTPTLDLYRLMHQLHLDNPCLLATGWPGASEEDSYVRNTIHAITEHPGQKITTIIAVNLPDNTAQALAKWACDNGLSFARSDVEISMPKKEQGAIPIPGMAQAVAIKNREKVFSHIQAITPQVTPAIVTCANDQLSALVRSYFSSHPDKHTSKTPIINATNNSTPSHTNTPEAAPQQATHSQSHTYEPAP